MSAVVSVENISKKFCRGLKRGMMYTLQDVGRDLVGRTTPEPTLRPEEFWAVRDLGFELRQGESLGLLGTNGAGKSTLLKMLNGIIRPDKGKITLRGRVGALIEVGAGFHPMLTGLENIYVNGAILGMTKRELDSKLDSIIAFSGLSSEILDAPVKTYSSGMYVRLGFAVAIHSEPDILLVDEVLAVGDSAFRIKCSEWIAGFLKRQGTLILVSHYLPSIRETCSKVIYMKGGEVVYSGSVMEGLQVYQNAIARPLTASEGNAAASGSPLQILGCRVSGNDPNVPIMEFDFAAPFKMSVEVEARQAMSQVHLHLVFSNQEVGAVGGYSSRIALPEGLTFPQGKSLLDIDLGQQNFVPGSYSVIAYLSDYKHLADYHEFIGTPFVIRPHSVVDARFGATMMKGTLHVH